MITGISALSGQQIIASGACSARSAATASYTTGGNDIQGLYTTVNSNSAAWAVGTTYTGDAQGALDEVYSKSGDWNTVTSKQAAGDYYSASNPSGFITGVDLTPYQTTAGMTAYQTAGDYLTTADSANFYTTANESGFITSVPDTYLQNTDLTITDGKITEISGVPLSAGDELPSGIMNTSALEYNAVNEISGYSGSAFAQYGAEKQWLQHDDTLLHVANSAQYALGVNISAVAQLLGVDETVLWETNGSDFIASGSTVNFSSNPYDYDKIKFVASSDEMAPVEITTYPSSARINVSWEQITNNQFRIWDTIVNIDSAGMTAGPAVMAMANSTGTGNSISTNQINWTWNYRLIKKVIGIGRRSNT